MGSDVIPLAKIFTTLHVHAFKIVPSIYVLKQRI